MTTDEDLRLVAEAVGFQKTIRLCGSVCFHSGHEAWLPPGGGILASLDGLRSDDGLAAKHLLPWLQRKAAEDPRVHLELSYYAMGGWEVCLMRHHEDGDDVVLHRFEDHSFAAALFDLCLAIIKENTT